MTDLTPREARRKALKESAIQQADTWWNLKSRDSIEQPTTAHVAELVAQVIMPLIDDLLTERTERPDDLLPAVFPCAVWDSNSLEIREPDHDDQVPVIIRGVGTGLPDSCRRQSRGLGAGHGGARRVISK